MTENEFTFQNEDSISRVITVLESAQYVNHKDLMKTDLIGRGPFYYDFSGILSESGYGVARVYSLSNLVFSKFEFLLPWQMQFIVVPVRLRGDEPLFERNRERPTKVPFFFEGDRMEVNFEASKEKNAFTFWGLLLLSNDDFGVIQVQRSYS